MASFGFRVFGVPKPQGSKIPGVSKSGKAFVREQAGEKLKNWRDSVTTAAISARGESQTITRAVHVEIIFFMPRPASISPKKRQLPSVAPDLDKMARGVLDSLTAAAVFKDDALVVSLRASKRYATDDPDSAPGAWIVIQEIV